MKTIVVIRVSDIASAIKELKNGKTQGLDNLSGEHFKLADHSIAVFLTMVFNCMLLHGYLPAKFMDTFIISLVKDKKGNISDVDNYRPVAITTQSSKVLETVLLHKFGYLLETGPNQFGFKKDHSTDMCVFVLREIVNYYHSLSGPVFACILDSSKAFDRVNHFHLFEKLLNRKVPKLVIRFLLHWYRTQSFRVKWDNILSGRFNVGNGVRQRGVLSPILFNVFIEDLSYELSLLKIGCRLNNVCYNHVNYADDSVLLAPTPEALQKLINVCQAFALRNDMMYNVTKSLCLAFLPVALRDSHLPSMFIGVNKLKWKTTHSYLGYIIVTDGSDDMDMFRQIRSFYARGNGLVRNCGSCSKEVKLELFRTFFNNVYMGHLWYKYCKSNFVKLKVAYNNIYRSLLKIKRRESISREYVQNRIDSFSCIRRKFIYSFYKRVMDSGNELVLTMVTSSYFNYSSAMFRKWIKLLFIL